MQVSRVGLDQRGFSITNRIQEQNLAVCSLQTPSQL
jgi:hypothetical protein